MIDKINKIVETIKKECPNGCNGLSCSECPLNNTENELGHEICEMLAKIDLLLPHGNRLRDSSARNDKQKLSRSVSHTIKQYSDTVETQPILLMEGSVTDAVQTAYNDLKKGKE